MNRFIACCFMLASAVSVAEDFSSEIGDGVCITVTGAIDPDAMVSEMVEGVGGYCSLSGCTMTGQLRVVQTGTDIVPNLRIGPTTTGGNPSIQFVPSKMCFNSSGSSCTASLNWSPNTLTLANNVAGLNFTLFGNFGFNKEIQLAGVATGSLPTCNAGEAGAIQYDTTTATFKGCNGTAPFVSFASNVSGTGTCFSGVDTVGGAIHGTLIIGEIPVRAAVASGSTMVIGAVHTIGGTVGGTYAINVIDATGSVTIASRTGIACTGTGTTTSVSVTTLAALAATDQLFIQIDTTGCTGNNPVLNVNVCF